MNRHHCLTAAAVTVTLIATTAITVNIRQHLPNNETLSCTIASKFTGDGPEQIQYLQVGTNECGSFRIADPVLLGPSGGALLFRSLEVGKRYTLTTRGDRIAMLGLIPDITSATPTE